MELRTLHTLRFLVRNPQVRFVWLVSIRGSSFCWNSVTSPKPHEMHGSPWSRSKPSTVTTFLLGILNAFRVVSVNSWIVVLLGQRKRSTKPHETRLTLELGEPSTAHTFLLGILNAFRDVLVSIRSVLTVSTAKRSTKPPETTRSAPHFFGGALMSTVLPSIEISISPDSARIP